MTLDQIALIAEIAAALAIFISLIFVGVQLRDNTRATRVATASDATRSLEDFYGHVGSSTELSDVLARGLQNPDALTAAQRVQFLALTLSFLLGQQHYFYAAKQGLLDSEIQNTLMMPIRTMSENPGIHWIWQQRRSFFRQEFRAEVDRILQEGAGDYGEFWQETKQKLGD